MNIEYKTTKIAGIARHRRDRKTKPHHGLGKDRQTA
jgi:hypothetical protein